MEKEIENIRNNPELIEQYLIEEEDKEVLREQGYRNFVDSCDDAEILYIIIKYRAATNKQ